MVQVKDAKGGTLGNVGSGGDGAIFRNNYGSEICRINARGQLQSDGGRNTVGQFRTFNGRTEFRNNCGGFEFAIEGGRIKNQFGATLGLLDDTTKPGRTIFRNVYGAPRLVIG